MRIATPLLALLLVTGAAAGARVHVSLVGRPPVLTTGTAWTAKLAVRPVSFNGSVRVTAAGPGRTTVRATGRRGSYRARFVFPKAGRWTLSALAGGSTSRLGAVTVRRRAEPLVFVNPTSVAVEPSGSILVVENSAGRVWRVNPSTGTRTVFASNLSRPYSVTTTPAGDVLLSTENQVVRLGPGAPILLATVNSQIGPIALAPNGDLYLTTTTTTYRVSAGTTTPVPVADGLAAPHGLRVAGDGALLISDTEHDRVLRVDPTTGNVTTFASIDGGPGALAVAADGTVYVCDTTAERIVRLTASGQRIGFFGPVFDTPYALAFAPDGGLYVVQSSARGVVKHVAPDGTVTTLSSR
jgi:streptogramin lyase